MVTLGLPAEVEAAPGEGGEAVSDRDSRVTDVAAGLAPWSTMSRRRPPGFLIPGRLKSGWAPVEDRFVTHRRQGQAL